MRGVIPPVSHTLHHVVLEIVHGQRYRFFLRPFKTCHCTCLVHEIIDLYSITCLTKEALDGLGDFNIGGQIIQTVKYADDLVLMAKEETALQGMIDKLIEIGRCYGMEKNVKGTKVMRISRQPSPVTIMIDQKQLENMECFKYFGSILTNDGDVHVKLNPGLPLQKLRSRRRRLSLPANWT